MTKKEAEEAVIKAAMELRNSGYDGPFIGEVCEPLFSALAAYERAEPGDMRPEYDFSGGVRGKYVRAFRGGDLEAFIDERLAQMQPGPRMWGTPEAVECECFLLVELYEKFCRTGEPRAIGPAEPLFMAFARKLLPRRPSPMSLAQWFTDTKWGSPEVKDVPEDELEHWAGQRIVDFFIAWKKELKG